MSSLYFKIIALRYSLRTPFHSSNNQRQENSGYGFCPRRSSRRRGPTVRTGGPTGRDSHGTLASRGGGRTCALAVRRLEARWSTPGGITAMASWAEWHDH